MTMTDNQKFEKYAADVAEAIYPRTLENKAKKLGEETAELAMAIAQYRVTNGEIDREHVIEEMGDCLFILAHIRSMVPGAPTLHECIHGAIKKAIKRHPGKYPGFVISLKSKIVDEGGTASEMLSKLYDRTIDKIEQQQKRSSDRIDELHWHYAARRLRSLGLTSCYGFPVDHSMESLIMGVGRFPMVAYEQTGTCSLEDLIQSSLKPLYKAPVHLHGRGDWNPDRRVIFDAVRDSIYEVLLFMAVVVIAAISIYINICK